MRRAYVHGFRMDRSPVTNEQYAEFVAACGVLPPDAEAISEPRYEELRQRFGSAVHVRAGPALPVGPDGPPHGAGAPSGGARQTRTRRGSIAPGAARGCRRAGVGARGARLRPAASIRGATATIRFGSTPRSAARAAPCRSARCRRATPPRASRTWAATCSSGPIPWPGRPGERVVKGNGWDGRGGFGRGAARVARHDEQKEVTLGFRCACGPLIGTATPCRSWPSTPRLDRTAVALVRDGPCVAQEPVPAAESEPRRATATCCCRGSRRSCSAAGRRAGRARVDRGRARARLVHRAARGAGHRQGARARRWRSRCAA